MFNFILNLCYFLLGKKKQNKNKMTKPQERHTIPANHINEDQNKQSVQTDQNKTKSPQK